MAARPEAMRLYDGELCGLPPDINPSPTVFKIAGSSKSPSAGSFRDATRQWTMVLSRWAVIQEWPSQCVQYFHRKMPTLVKATALAAVIIALLDVSSAAACHHFSIWRFPWPQRCPAKQIGQFIHNASPPTPSPAPPPKPIQDEESQRQQAIEKLKEQLKSQKQQ